MGFVANQVIGDYEFLGIIDKPRTGVTYKVRNLSTGEFETLRALAGTTSQDPESVERLLREIRVHTRLCHPNILMFHDAFEIEGHLAMTTEFVEGRTLGELCHASPLPLSEAIGTIDQVLDGLEEAHALGIVHRGITAEHVTVGLDGAVKLGGFGLAKPASDSNLTQVGMAMGDPRYISPEQVMGRGALDGRSDLYSVGVLLYQTLTGKLPFESRNDFEVLAAQVGSEPQPPSTVNPAISPELDRIVLTALKKNPDERFRNAREFRTALAAAAAVATQAAQAAQAAGNWPRPVPTHLLPKHGTRRSLPQWLVFGLLALAIGLAIISWLAMH
jgi:eukaryotic-like serine/threonine-protein kinase